MSTEQEQKFRNLILLGAPVSDKDIEEMGPFLGILMLLVALVIGGFVCYNKFFDEPKENVKAVIVEDKNPAKPIDSLKVIVGDSI